jgi:hypothetical protein
MMYVFCIAKSSTAIQALYADIEALEQKFSKGRLCEAHNTEPQKKGETREDANIIQWQTVKGGFGPEQDIIARGTLVAFAKALAQEGYPKEGPNPSYGDDDYEELHNVPVWMVPWYVMRVFHPTRKGHAIISQAVQDKINEIQNPNGDLQPIDPNAELQCFGGMPTYFPDSWGFSDGTANTQNLFYRLRQEVCGGACSNIQGVDPGEFSLSKVGTNGCAAAVKISAYKEVYVYASHWGRDNCGSVTARLIDQCPGNHERYLEGPNPSKSFLLGPLYAYA